MSLLYFLVRKYNGNKAFIILKVILAGFLSFVLLSNFYPDTARGYDSLWNLAIQHKSILLPLNLFLLAINIVLLLLPQRNLYLIACGLYLINIVLYFLAPIPLEPMNQPARTDSSMIMIGYLFGFGVLVASAAFIDKKLIEDEALKRSPFKVRYSDLVLVISLGGLFFLFGIGSIAAAFLSGIKGLTVFYIAGGTTFLLVTLYIIIGNFAPKWIYPNIDKQISNVYINYFLIFPFFGVMLVGGGLLFLSLFMSFAMLGIIGFILKLAGAIAAYWYVTYKQPGLRVVMTGGQYMSETQNKKQKVMDAIVVRYKSQKLVIITLIAFILFDIIYNFSIYFSNSSQKSDSIEMGLFSGLVVFGSLFALFTGLKFLSTWIRVRGILQRNPAEIKNIIEDAIEKAEKSSK